MRVCRGCVGAVLLKPVSFKASRRSFDASGSMTIFATRDRRAHSTRASTASADAGTGPRGTYTSRVRPTLRICTLAIAPPEGRRRRSTFHPARDWTSPQPHDCRSGDRSVLDLEREDSLRRFTDDPVQRDLDHAAMCDHQHIAMLMPGQDPCQRAGDARIENGGAFATRHHVPVRFFDPACPGLWISLSDLFRMQSFPFAEIDLPERHRRLGCQPHNPPDHLCRLEGTLEVARVET